MRIPRIYQDAPLPIDSEFELDERAQRHLTQVLRLRPPAPLILFNGNGREYRATLQRLERKQAMAWIVAATPGLPESPLPITLAQAIAKGERMDIVLQKATELGVKHIQPLHCQRSMAPPPADRLARRMAHWQGIVIAACEQCGRSDLPTLSAPMGLADWLARDAELAKIVLDPSGQDSLSIARPPEQGCGLLVGPEGGWAGAEITRFADMGCLRLRLGPRTLRTETAALTAIALLQARWGDLG